MASVVKTLRGGPHDKLKLTLPNKDYLPPAFRLVERSGLGVLAPHAVYVLKHVEQKNRTIKVYEFSPDGYNPPDRRGQAYTAALRIYNRGTQ